MADSFIQELRADIAEIKASVANIDDTLRGKAGQDGLVARVSTLEKSDARRSKYTYLAVSAALTALGSAAWGWLTGKP